MYDQIIRKVSNRINEIMRLGKITASANETGGVQLIQIVKSAIEGVQDNIKSYQYFGFTSSPMAGSTDHVLIASRGDPNHAIAIASNDQLYRPKNLSSGETQIYSAYGNYVYLKADGSVVVTSPNLVTVNAPSVVINGNVQVNGTITATGDIKAGTISLESHVHGGVLNGSGDTGAAIG